MYFSKFPPLLYSLDLGKTHTLITDFLRRVDFIKTFIENAAVYELYDIKDGETPDILADRLYGNSTYHWIIMLANDIVDPVLDWPMTQNELLKFCLQKYGETNIYLVHHYEDSFGMVVNQSPEAYPVSNFQYESNLNEAKRQIKIIRKELIADVAREFTMKIGD